MSNFADPVLGGHHTLQPAFHSNHIALRAKDGMEFSVLDKKTTKAMLIISKFPKTRFECIALANDLQKIVSAWKSKSNDITIPVETVVYGPARLRDQIGRILSDAYIYLQYPEYCIARPYDNPHEIKFAFSFQSTEAVHPVQSRETQKSGEAIQEIMNHLDHRGITDKMGKISERLFKIIRTTLLSHQLVGVNFIAQREGRRLSEIPSLWTRAESNVATYFEHAVTGARKSQALDEFVGGIISDEMGLGKTLTMLAAVVDSLLDAEAFADVRNSQSLSQATLVIVPSVCKSEPDFPSPKYSNQLFHSGLI